MAPRRRLLLAAGAVSILLVLGCSDDDSGGDAGGRGDPPASESTTTTLYFATPDAAEAFVAAVRAGPGAAPLERFSDDDLTAQGEAFCDALARTGSALEAAGELQDQTGDNPGQTALIASARTHLCPELEGASAGG